MRWKGLSRVCASIAALAGLCTLAFGPRSWCASDDKALIISTSDVRVRLVAGSKSPSAATLAGPGQLAWQNRASEPLPDSVQRDGKQVPLIWKRTPSLDSISPRHVVLVYESANPHLRLKWEWEARASFGPIDHTVNVENLSSDELWMPLIDSLRLDWQVSTAIPLTHFYVEKGADSPSPEGTHVVDISENYRWTGWSTTYAHPVTGRPREIIPYEVIYSKSGTQAGWYAGLEFSGRTHITLNRSQTGLDSVLGLDPEPGPFRTRLMPGEHFITPRVFIGASTGGADGAGNQLRPWVRAVLNSPQTWKDPQYPVTVNNSWGSGMQVDEALAKKMIADSSELGVELFGLDAGWFRGVADWYPNPKKFPNGLAAIADEAHRNHLRFGIWVDWTQAALDTQPGALNVRDPKVRNWLVADVAPDWKPEDFKGQTIDIGVPAAHDWAAHEVKRLVEDYHLDMLEHDGYLVAQGCTGTDHPHAPPDPANMSKQHDSGSDFIYSSNSTDVSYHAVRAYYDIYQKLRREHPGLLLEICNDGGRMVDFGSAAHGDYFSITDTYDPLSNRRAFYDTSFALPAPMLESYVERWPTPHIENFRYMLRSGMMGWLTIMQDTNAWSPKQHDEARAAIALYKQSLRPLIRDARLYHVSPRPDGVHWDAIEYFDPARKSGVVYAFRGTIADEPAHTFTLAGLRPNKLYRLHFHDATAADSTASGHDLMTIGLAVKLPIPLSSELVFLEEKDGH
jgi:hypothetical protein